MNFALNNIPGLAHFRSKHHTLGIILFLTAMTSVVALLLGVKNGFDFLTANMGVGTSWGGMLALIMSLSLPTLCLLEARRFTRTSTLPRVIATVASDKTGSIGLMGVTVFMVLTLLAPMVAPFDPISIGVGPASIGPTAIHILGTDEFGRDLFSRLLYGGQISLTIGVVSVGIALTVGVAVGAISGWFGGIIDWIGCAIMDLFLALPRLVLLLAIMGIFRLQGAAGVSLIIIILGLTGWMKVGRIVRAEVLVLKERNFILSARALGLSTSRIIIRHILPNALPQILVFASLAVGTTILTEAGLSFLGLGISPPTPSWGVLINDGRGPLLTAPHIATFSGLCVAFAVTSFNLLGDALRDALDPKLSGN